MLHIACCGTIPIADSDACCREVLEQCAADLGFDALTVDHYDTPLALIDSVTSPKSSVVVDVVVCGMQISGLSGIEFVRDLRAAGYAQRIIMCVDDCDSAFEAIRLRVMGFLVEPAMLESVQALFTRMLRAAAEDHKHSIELRTRDGARRIDLRRLVYVTTVDHDQEIHMLDGACESVRMSSQAFFDLVSHSGRFYKAGSSYIVNINMVRRINQSTSTAEMADGTVIPIPGRVRKGLEEAILANE